MDGDRVPGFSTLALHAGGLDGAGQGPHALAEERIAALEGGTAAVVLSSGLAAQLTSLLVLLRRGDELIASERLGDAAEAQFKRLAVTFGWHVAWADPEEPAAFERAVSPRTRAIFAATLAADGAVVTDLAALSQIARRAQVPLIVDNTLATPFLTRPLDHGADIVIHSAGPFLASGADAGIVVDGGRFNWLREKRYPVFLEPRAEHGGSGIGEAYGNFAFAMACREFAGHELGAIATAEAAVAVLAGTGTLALRMQRHSASALAVAEHLSGHDRVDWVSYPGLPGDRHHNLARKYCPGGSGAIVGIGLAGGSEGIDQFFGRTRLVAPSERLGGTRSSALAGEGSVRLSVGLEDVADILADLDEALTG